jgi:two-component system, response regulator PdtaR
MMDIIPQEMISISDGSPVRLRAMIIEDETIIGVFLSDFLIETGYDVCAIASTELEAVTFAAKYKPDFIIADAKLRFGTGIAAMEKILRQRFVPHVFISGYRLNELSLDPRTVFLHKPFSQAALGQAILKAFDFEN